MTSTLLEGPKLVDQDVGPTYASPEVIRIHPRRVISRCLGADPKMQGRDVHGAAPSEKDGS